MAQRTDPETTWSVYADGHRAVRAWLEGLPESDWARDSVLPGWSLADLAAHVGRVADSVTNLAEAPRGVPAGTVGQYIAAYAAVADAVADTARAIAAEASGRPEAILAAIDERFAASAARVEQLGFQDRVVTGGRGPIRLGEHLLTRVIEIVVHADDLARSASSDEPVDLPRDAERITVRALLDVLAERAPGRTVEVRVPPYAAVQCIEGPRHTRGTPPNVVEADPWAWIRVGAGRASWDDELATGRVSASGERADLSAYLPLL